MNKIKRYIYLYREKKALKRFRREVEFWGIDMNEYSDSEIKAAICYITGRLSHTGLTCQQAAMGLSKMMNAANTEF